MVNEYSPLGGGEIFAILANTLEKQCVLIRNMDVVKFRFYWEREKSIAHCKIERQHKVFQCIISYDRFYALVFQFTDNMGPLHVKLASVSSVLYFTLLKHWKGYAWFGLDVPILNVTCLLDIPILNVTGQLYQHVSLFFFKFQTMPKMHCRKLMIQSKT